MIQSDHPVDAQTTVHSVHLGRYRQHGWLQVDRQRNVSDQSPGQLFGLNVFSEFYIGGHDTFDLDLLPNDLNFTSGFTGRYEMCQAEQLHHILFRLHHQQLDY